MTKFNKIKFCKTCTTELKRIDNQRKYCSQWCRETRIKIIGEKEIKPRPLRKCKCGNDLRKQKQKCDDCLSKPYEYTKYEHKCLNCNGDIYGRLHKKYLKKFCEAKCSKAYYYKLKKQKEYENLG